MFRVKTREAVLSAIVLVFVVVMAVYIATANGIEVPLLSNLIRTLLGG
jgi:conjugal transfer/entry exclusion protein